MEDIDYFCIFEAETVNNPLTYQGDDGTINFSVSDTGIGIAECDRERIFTQFTKVSYFTEGVGLGLSMSKQTAQRLGGDLLIDTSYQGGSRFVLTLKTT